MTDFGIARAAAGDSRLTVTGVAIGTPAYMSPEQALGERELDGRSDIYSLGIIGYQMLAGEPPFKASNTPAMLVKHVSETPRPLEQLRPDVPRELVHAIARALAKKPEDRWADAAAFRDALSGVARGAAVRGAHPRAAPAAPRPVGDSRQMLRATRDCCRNLPAMPPDAGACRPGERERSGRHWRREHKQWELERRAPRARSTRRRIRRRLGRWRNGSRAFRRRSVGSLVTVASLAVVNAGHVAGLLLVPDPRRAS